MVWFVYVFDRAWHIYFVVIKLNYNEVYAFWINQLRNRNSFTLEGKEKPHFIKLNIISYQNGL